MLIPLTSLLVFKVYSLVSVQDGWTALHKASEKGHCQVVKQLIAAKAQVDIQEEVRL